MILYGNQIKHGEKSEAGREEGISSPALPRSMKKAHTGPSRGWLRFSFSLVGVMTPAALDRLRRMFLFLCHSLGHIIVALDEEGEMRAKTEDYHWTGIRYQNTERALIK